MRASRDFRLRQRKERGSGSRAKVFLEKKYGFTSIIYEVAKKRGPQPKSKVQVLVICYVTER